MRNKFPQSPDEIFSAYLSDWHTIYAEQLESVLFYGGSARGEYVPGASNIEFLIVLSEPALRNLRPAVLLSEKWRARAQVLPLVVTRAYIARSLDSFPVEFLYMRRQYRVLHGDDVLAGLAIRFQDLRLQLERELKGKLLHLRNGFLHSGYDRDELKSLMRRTLTAFLPLFEAFLFLKQEKIPVTRREIFQRVAQVASFPAGFIDKIFQVSEEDSRPYREELWQIMEEYIVHIAELTQIVDALVS